MTLIAVGLVLLAFLIAPAADAQPGLDPGSMRNGQRLYESHCTLCHKDGGLGDPSTFPALRGNDRLMDLARIVNAIRVGSARMPAFPNLTAEEIAALANYVRTAWANAYGSVSTEEVAALLDQFEKPGAVRSTWDSVFIETQAKRGELVYLGPCGLCHGRELDGAPDDPDYRATPPLARAKFLRDWEGRSLASLFEYTRATMPENNPGSLTDEEYVDVIAYMLSLSGMPAGDVELRPDTQSLARIVIRRRP
jgi:mono/diheme cytochrome c family protein